MRSMTKKGHQKFSNIACMALSWREKHLFRKKIPWWHPFFTQFVFHTHPITLLLEVLGERMHGPSPSPQIFWGDRPPSPPPKSPCHMYLYRNILYTVLSDAVLIACLPLYSHISAYMINESWCGGSLTLEWHSSISLQHYSPWDFICISLLLKDFFHGSVALIALMQEVLYKCPYKIR